MSRSTSTSSATTTTSQGVTSSLSLRANNKSQPLNPLAVSDVKLFVTNLRLLDLDLRSDWPDITVQTFSAKNADQKQRIAATEWSLFRLFELWDPDETTQKLQPFFPPLEPLQSLNLRAALYRCLNELKKNAVLGRESVLRKTMLDECKGDKFYEILAIFSNLVMKKMFLAQKGRNKNVAIAPKLATASVLSADKQRSLLPLAIAHQAALINVLKQKEEKRRRFLDFEKFLDNKTEDINRRISKFKGTPRSKTLAVSQKEAELVKKQLKDNWIGDQKWLNVMLYGDNAHGEDSFFTNGFEKIWRTVEAGREIGSVENEIGLLQNLQLRLNEQQDRLKQWKAFEEELQENASRPKEKVEKAPTAVKEIKLDDHLKYQLPTSKQKSVEVSIVKPPLRTEYQQILADLDTELSHIANNGSIQPLGMALRRRRSSASVPRSPARRRLSRSEPMPPAPLSPVRTAKLRPQTREQSMEQIPLLPQPRHIAAAATPLDSEATLIGHPSTVRGVSAAETQLRHKPEREPTPPSSDPIAETSFTSPPNDGSVQSPQSPAPSSSPEPPSVYPSEPPIPIIEPPKLSDEEALAEQIISAIGDATPSPVKKPQPRMSLSLAERTRMSMARTTSFESVPESPDLPMPSISPPLLPIEEQPDGRATLLERTRLSMVAMQNKPRMSMAARDKREKRMSRQSLFPVNQFDTPRNRKSIERIEEIRSTQCTPKEELFSDEVDYDRIFKSRPRIATSPVFTPHQQVEDIGEGDEEDDGDEEVTGIDLGDVDQDEDEDGFTKSWADSPSRQARPRD